LCIRLARILIITFVIAGGDIQRRLAIFQHFRGLFQRLL